MKKMLAWLLVLMLPLCALSDTYGVSFSVDTDENLFCDFLRKELLSISDTAYDAQMDNTIRLIEELLDGLTLEFTVQEDAVAVNVEMCGGTLFDMVFHAKEDKLVVTSTLLDGYALTEDMQRSSADEAVLAEVDWKSLLEGVKADVMQWADNLNPVITEGAFVGDAFEGGTLCKTWALTDRDIANLVSQILSGDVRDAVTLALNAMGLDADKLLTGIDTLNQRVSSENKYQYLVRSVSNELGALVGISLTICNETSQLATVSLGLTEKSATLVFGFGLQDMNYWCELTAVKSGKGKLLMLNGKSQEWVAEKKQGFAYVKNRISPVSNVSWYCNVTQSGKRYLWDISIYEGDKTSYAYYYSSAGTVNPSTGVLDCSFSIGDAPYIPVTLKVQCGPAAEISPLDETLVQCAADDQPLYQELLQQMSAAIMARMIKLIPLDMLLQLNLPFIP